MRNALRRVAATTIVGFGLGLGSPVALADQVNQAYKIHRRLTGINPSKKLLDQMVQALKEGRSLDAALLAIDNDEHARFYNELVRFFDPWLDKEGKNSGVLNASTAFLIGFLVQNRPFNQILSANLFFYFDNVDAADLPDGASIPPPDPTSNQHFALAQKYDVNFKKYLKAVPQTSPIADPNGELAGHDTVPAGLYTTRGWAEKMYFAGTNRAAVAYSLRDFTCTPIEGYHDTTLESYVGRDVDRAPSGEPITFLQKCQGCHKVQDPMRDAFAYLDWDDTAKRMVFTKPHEDTPWDEVQCAVNAEVVLNENSTYADKLQCAVAGKFASNKHTFPDGHVTRDDTWANFATKGNNAAIGWAGEKGEIIRGTGPKELGAMLVKTKAFPRCMAKKVWEYVCKDENFDSQIVKDNLERLSTEFVTDNYDMKKLFAKTAVFCMGY